MSHIIDYYTSSSEREWSRLDREPLEFLINWRYIMKYLPESGMILDNGAGPGKYSMELARNGYKVTLTDLTPKLVEFAQSKAHELGLMNMFSGFHSLDATNLTTLPDEHFDASLMLGPLYHLQSQQDRDQAVKELRRVTKVGGVVCVAFRSRINHMMTSLLHPEQWKPNDSIDGIRKFWSEGTFNHSDKGRYTGAYFYHVEDIKPFMEQHGFESINLIGSTNIGVALNQQNWDCWKNKGEGEYQKLIDLLVRMAREPSVLGMSSHLMYIGIRK